MTLGAGCCLWAYLGLRGIHAVAPKPLLKGEEPTYVLTQVWMLTRLTYVGIGLVVTGVVVAVANAAGLARANRNAHSTVAST